jgi:aminobenzoyl-glutamate utilization protein B
MAQKIWANPEECLKEEYACDLQKTYMKEQGFKITESKKAPTGFMAEYGSGGPVLGLLGEYDALKNLSQAASCEREILKAGGPGHGCGHNLLGVGCLGAAVAVKELIAKGQITGTVRYYGCPAEEMIMGKVLMADEGLFSGLDAALTWHPSIITMPWAGSLLSIYSAIFTFKGKSAHAGASPHLGRSALDAVELMNVGANYMREHVMEQNRIHYIITKGGAEPNTVPDEAAVWYNLRSPSKDIARESFKWLVEIARGAAMMTQTQLADINIISGCYEVLTNQTLIGLIDKNMNALGGPGYTEEDRAFAAAMSGGYDPMAKAKALESGYVPLSFLDDSLHEGVEPAHDINASQKASTDVGDVSWMMPTAMFGVATWPLGVAAHSWQAVAASGSGVGYHAMIYAAKVLAATLVDMYTDPDTLNKAKAEFKKAVGDKVYQPVYAETF